MLDSLDLEEGSPKRYADDGQLRPLTADLPCWARGWSEAGVTFGLLAAWAVHDLEEVAAMPGWARGRVPGLRRAGVLRSARPRDVAQGLALAAAATARTHAVARQLLRRGRTVSRLGRSG
ncbi:HXXEE domain-containing protein [Streptomyces prunicolor]|uniref:HXXEE domain-containing protein n=1 Tax=Streptomyces prunicolor TaxID=67348 RepID=UPI003429ADA2